MTTGRSFRFGLLSLCVLIGLAPLFFHPPDGVPFSTWALFAIFLFALAGLIFRPMPSGAITILALAFALVTHTIDFQRAAYGFQSEVIWLILSAYFFARGFIKSGLGFRVGYHLMALFGKSTLGLGYAVGLTDLLMAPGIPSNTARNGAIVYPIVLSMARTYGGEKPQGLRRFGLFLTQAAFQAGVVTSAMFLTSMAANPLIAGLAGGFGFHIDFALWFKAAIVPGLVCLALIPPILLFITKPEIRKTENAGAMAREHLAKLGPFSFAEKALCGIFLLLIVLWICGVALFGLSATVVALLGLALLLVLGVIDWDDVLHEKAAWDTFIWFSIVLSFTEALSKLGFFHMMTGKVAAIMPTLHPLVTLGLIAVSYFYSHYFFASLVAHMAAMYVPFVTLALALGAPIAPTCLLLAYMSSLFGSLTHYGSASAPIFFGSGYGTAWEWLKSGFVIGTMNLLVFAIVGGLWWKMLGLF